MKALLIWNNLWAGRCMCVFFIHSLGHLMYLSCVHETVSRLPQPWSAALLLSPSSPIYLLTLRPPVIRLGVPPPSFTCHCLIASRFPPRCDVSRVLSINCFHCFYHLSLCLSPFLLLSHFISIFSHLHSSLYPFSEGIQWIIQKPCWMIMGN